MNNEITFGYWKIRGLGARVRLIFEYTGLPYKEVFYTPEIRAKWFDEEKPELAKKNPAITLPYILDGDKVISESDATVIYAIHKSGKVELLGRNAEEQVAVATVIGVFKDLYKVYLEFIYGELKESAEEAKPKYVEKFRPYLTKLSGLLGEREYMCGEITYADFFVAEFIQHLNLFEPALFENDFKNLIAHQQRIWNIPAIKSYVESDRYIDRPVNYVHGKWK